MKSYNYYLSSFSFNVTNILNGYLFVDPITTNSPSYPLTADGGIGSNFTAYSSAFSLTAWDGYFYPYGTGTQNTYVNDILPNLKGDYTICFCASGLTAPLQIIYNFGDGTYYSNYQTYLSNDIFSDINTYLYGLNNISVKYKLIYHTYYAAQSAITIFPSITVINSDLSLFVYNLQFTQYPNSVYDIASFKVIDSTQQISDTNNSLNVIEISDYDQISPIVLSKTGTSTYPIPTLLSAVSG